MSTNNPLEKPRQDFDQLIARLSNPDSPVGIDVQYTHAIIIDYLSIIAEKVAAIEKRLENMP